jgi:hypothetical protein
MRIWSEMDKMAKGTSDASMVSRKSYHLSRSRKASSAFDTPSSPTGPVSSPPTTPIRNRKSTGGVESTGTRGAVRVETGRQRVSRGRGVIGGDGALVALTPITVDVRMNGGSPARRAEKVVYSGEIAGRNSSGKKKKEKEKDKGWGWTGWW